MKKISQKVKTKIIVTISLILGYSVVFMLLFECFFINRDLESEYPKYNYGESVLFEGVFRPISERISGGDLEIVLMFRWKYNKLLEAMKFNVYRELDFFLEENTISDFDVDEQRMNVNMTVNKIAENKRKIFYLTIKEIQDTCSLWYIFTYKKLPEKSQAEVTLYDEAGNQIEDVPVLAQEEVEKEEERKAKEAEKNAYNEQDIKCLEGILSYSRNKKAFDFSDEWKIKGDSQNGKGGNISYLDLSDYSDITGELDLSDFTNLRRVALRGMNIGSVVLPDTLVSIEPATFDNCEMLEKITIPKSVTSFSNPIFSGCKSLKEIVFEGNAPNVSWDKENVFGDVPQDLIIYRRRSAKGWQEQCWDKYDVRIMEE